MANIDGLTDEYSDYSFIRRLAGITGVVGFGILSGASLMKLNNSAVLRSLGHEWETRGKWKHYTGSILSTGSVVNRSTLVRESLERAQKMGYQNTDYARITDTNTFLDKVLKKQKEITSHKIREAEDIERLMLEAQANIEEQGIRVRRKGGRFTDELNKVFKASTEEGMEKTYRPTLEKLLDYHKIEAEELANSNVLHPSSKLVKETRTLMSNKWNDLTKQRRDINKEIRSLVKEIKLNKNASSRLVNFNDEINLAQNKIESLEINKEYVQNDIEELKILQKNLREDLSDPNYFNRHDTGWLKDKLQIKMKGKDPSTWTGLNDVRIYGTKLRHHQTTTSIIETALSLENHVKNVNELQTNVYDFIEKAKTKIATGQIPQQDLEFINRAMPTIEDFAKGTVSLDDFSDRMYALQNTSLGLYETIDDIVNHADSTSASMYDDMKKISKIRKKAGYTKSSFDRLVESRPLFKNMSGLKDIPNREVFSIGELLDEFMKVPESILGKNISDFGRRNIDQIEIEQRIEFTDATTGKDLPPEIRLSKIKKSEMEVIRDALVSSRSKLRDYRTTKGSLSPALRSLLRHEVMQESRNINLANKFAGLLSHDISTKKSGDVKSILGAGKILNDNFINFDINNTNQMNEMVDDALRHANLIRKKTGSSTANKLYEIYQGIKPHKMNAFEKVMFTTTGAATSGLNAGISRKFGDVFLHKTKGLKGIINALKDTFGADDIITGVKTQTDSSFMTLRLIPKIKGRMVKPLDIEMPIGLGNMIFKNRRAYISTGKATGFGEGAIEIKSSMRKYFDDIISSIETQKPALERSLDKETMESSFNKLRTMIRGKFSTIYGNKGTAGEGLVDFTDKSFMEGIQAASYVDYVSLRNKSSKLNIELQEKKIALMDIEYFSLHGDTSIPESHKAKLLDELEIQRRRLRKMRAGTSDALDFTQKLAYAKTVTIDGMPKVNINKLIEQTNGLFSPTISGIAAENVMRGRFMTLDAIHAFVYPDIARNMKAVYNTMDTLDMVKMKMFVNNKGFMLGKGNNLGMSLEDKMTIRGILLTRNTRDSTSPIMKQYDKFRVDAKKEISKTQRELVKLVKNTGETRDFIDDTIGHFFKNVGDPTQPVTDKMLKRAGMFFTNNEANDKVKYLLKQQSKLVKAKSLNDFITGHDYAKGMVYSLLNDNEIQEMNTLTKAIYGTPLTDMVHKPVAGSKSTSFITSEVRDMLKTMGYTHKNSSSHVAPPDPFGIKQLKMFQTDLPMLADGVTILSQTGVNKMGPVIKQAEAVNFNVKNLQSIFTKEAKKLGNIDTKKLAKIKKAIGYLKETIKNKKTYKISDIFNLINNESDFLEFTETINEMLQSGDSKILKAATDENMLIKAGKGTAVFSGISFHGDQMRMQYKFIRNAIPGSKFLTESTDKYLVNAILDNDDMLRLQRSAIIGGFNSEAIGKNLSHTQKKVLNSLTNNYGSKSSMFVADSDWRKFLSIVKGADQTTYSMALRHGNTVYDGINTNGRIANQAGRATNKGRLYSVFDDLLNIKIKGQNVQDSAPMRELMSDVLSDILDVSSGNKYISDTTKRKFDLQSIYKKEIGMISGDKITVSANKYGRSVDFKEKNLRNLYDSLTMLHDVASDSTATSEYLTAIKTKLDDKVKDTRFKDIFLGRSDVKKGFINTVIMKMRRMMALANPKGALKFETPTINVMELTQDPFELTRHTTKGSYNIISGFDKGAKINVYDALMMKMSGMPYTGDKILQYAKHGRGYLQSYVGSLMEMFGMNPETYMSGHIPNTKSNALITSMGSSKMQQDILKMKKEVAMAHWDEGTGMAKKLGLTGLFDVSSDINTDFLEKGIFTKEFLDNMDYDKELTDLITSEISIRDRGTNIKGLLENIDEVLKQETIQDIASGKSVNDQIKIWMASSSRVHIDDIEKYQKLTRKYKSVIFGTDPMAPRYNLFMNSSRGRPLASMNIHSFGYDKLYNREAVEALQTQVDKYREISILRTGEIEGISSGVKTPYVILNEAHRAQLATLKAMHSGAAQKVIQGLHQNYVEALSRTTGSMMTDSLKKGLPGTASAAGRGLVSFNAHKLNIWSILDEMEAFDGDIKKIMQPLNWRALDEEAASKVAKNMMNIMDAGGKKESFETALSKMLEVGKTTYQGAPGEVLMSSTLFQSTAESLNYNGTQGFNKHLSKVMKDMYQLGNQSNFMAMGIRYPTLKELNTLPLRVSIFDNKVLSKIGLGKGRLADKLADAGMSETMVMNLIDAKQMGGDLDRDMFMALLGIDEKFGPGSKMNTELANQMKRQFSVKYEVENLNGEKSVVVTQNIAQSKTRGGDLIQRASEDITSSYDKLRKEGFGHEYSIEKAMQEKGVKTGSIQSEDGTLVKTYFTKEDKRILLNNDQLDALTPTTKGEIDSLKIFNQNSEFKKRLFNSLKEGDPATSGVLTPDDLGDFVSQFQKHKGGRNALLLNAKNNLLSQMDSAKRTLEAMGKSSEEIDGIIEGTKRYYATIPENKLLDKLKQSGNKQLNAILSQEFREKLPELTGSLVAVKSLTGEIHNIGKYTLGNLAMTLFDPETQKEGYQTIKKWSKALETTNWTGNLSQANISAKHKIPLITGDVIKSINTLIDPNSSPTALQYVKMKMEVGEFDSTMSPEELSDIIKTNKSIEMNSNLLTKDSMDTAKEISRISHKVQQEGLITNIEYKNYLESLQKMSKESTDMRSSINLSSPQSRRELESAIKGINKSIDYSKNASNVILEHRHELASRMKTAGINNIRQIGETGKILQSNLTKNGFKMEKALRGLTNPFTTLESSISDIIFDKQTQRMASRNADAIFHNHSVKTSIDRALGSKIAKKVKNSSLSKYVDADSFSRIGIGGLLGLAVVGFIGAMAIQSNKRDWLGPTPGTGGEYAERIRSKDEEKIANMNIVQRMKKRGIRIGANHYANQKSARLMPKGIKKQHGPKLIDQIREISQVGNMPDQMGFHRFNS